ncbi:MAG: hypothetical protein K0Q84_2338 [Arthrobacter sp.]|nr:hypothetical protein [Arthrobacter sp.]
MLRVRPVHFTSRIEEWEQLFTDLGMVKTLDDGNWREFDAASGRIALQHTPADAGNDGTTSLAVEVGDVEEFARRTNLAASEMGNTPAELIPADVGDSCRITGGDGFSFMADKATHWAQCAAAPVPALRGPASVSSTTATWTPCASASPPRGTRSP